MTTLNSHIQDIKRKIVSYVCRMLGKVPVTTREDGLMISHGVLRLNQQHEFKLADLNKSRLLTVNRQLLRVIHPDPEAEKCLNAG